MDFFNFLIFFIIFILNMLEAPNTLYVWWIPHQISGDRLLAKAKSDDTPYSGKNDDK